MSKNKLTQQHFFQLLENRASEYQTTDWPAGKLYKLAAEWLGIYPWRIIIPLSLIIAFILILFLRSQAIKGVSLLQWGF